MPTVLPADAAAAAAAAATGQRAQARSEVHHRVSAGQVCQGAGSAAAAGAGQLRLEAAGGAVLLQLPLPILPAVLSGRRKADLSLCAVQISRIEEILDAEGMNCKASVTDMPA